MRLINTTDRPVSATTVEPVTLALTKKALRLVSTAEDALIEAWIAAARAYFEEQTGRQCIEQEREYALDGVPSQRVIELPRAPLLSVTSITYDDAAGAAQTLDAALYAVHPSYLAFSPATAPAIDPFCKPGWVELGSTASWPGTSGLSNSLRIRYVCGYGSDASDMPAILQAALYLLIGHFDKHREEVTDEALTPLPLGAQALINAFKWTALPLRPPAACVAAAWLTDPAVLP